MFIISDVSNLECVADIEMDLNLGIPWLLDFSSNLFEFK